MTAFRISLVLFSAFILSGALVIPKNDGASKRVHENKLSDETHYKEEEFHNADYDHEAFLGENEAKTFDKLSPEESKRRLGLIVDKIDSDKNGFVSVDELSFWIGRTQRRYIEEDADRQWRGLVPSPQDTELTWTQYKKNTYGYTDESESDVYNYKAMMERDLRRWQQADSDGDGSLDKREFTDFTHPEDTQHMKEIVVVETIEDIDKDHDGKISLQEYIGDMYEQEEEGEGSEPDWLEGERDQFHHYRDKDKSGFMEFEEVRDWILPDDYDNSDSEAKHLLYESDLDRDNQLSKEEILDKYDLFVGSQATDFGEALERHDEF